MDKSSNHNIAIDACRPGDVFGLNENDLGEQEMSDLRESLLTDRDLQATALRSSGFDRRIGSAFSDIDEIEPPAGLADRLLASLETTTVTATHADTSPACESPANQSASDTPIAQANVKVDSASVSRRKWLGAGLVVCGVVAASTLLGLFLLRPNNITRDQLIEEVVMNGGWIEQSLKREQADEGWATDFTLAPNLRPQDNVHLARDASGWRYSPVAFDRNAVEYDLRHHPTELPVFCYVLGGRLEVADLPTAPPIKPQSRSGGWTVAAWQTNGCVYVLAVEGDRTRYQQMRKQFDIASLQRPMTKPSMHKYIAG